MYSLNHSIPQYYRFVPPASLYVPESEVCTCCTTVWSSIRGVYLLIVKTVINTYLLLLLGHTKGWSGDANVLGKIFSAGRPTNFDYSRARVYIACSRCDWLILGLTALSGSISVYIGPFPRQREKDWLVGCFGLNGPLRQYFSLYQAVS